MVTGSGFERLQLKQKARRAEIKMLQKDLLRRPPGILRPRVVEEGQLTSLHASIACAGAYDLEDSLFGAWYSTIPVQNFSEANSSVDRAAS